MDGNYFITSLAIKDHFTYCNKLVIIKLNPIDTGEVFNKNSIMIIFQDLNFPERCTNS